MPSAAAVAASLFAPRNSGATLPPSYWLAGAQVPAALREGQNGGAGSASGANSANGASGAGGAGGAGPAGSAGAGGMPRDVQGGRCALRVQGGRITALEPTPQGSDPVFDLDGATVLPAFVDAHVHLDKGDLLATGQRPERDLLAAIGAVRRDYAHWSAHELHARIGFALRSARAHGTRHLMSYCDWPAPPSLATPPLVSRSASASASASAAAAATATAAASPSASASASASASGSASSAPAASTSAFAVPPAWNVLLELREAWAGRVGLGLASLASIDLLADAAAADALAREMAAAGATLGLFVYAAPHTAAMLPLAFDLAERHDLAIDFHVDEHLDPLQVHLGEVATLARQRGWGPRTTCAHGCALGTLAAPQRDAVLDLIAASGLTLVCLPFTNLFLQDSTARGPRRTPQLRGLMPVHEARQRGIPVALASDNHRDMFFPGGDLDPLQALALGTLALQLDDPIEHWSDSITSTPARALGLAWDGVLRPGAPADLVLHPGRHSAEVMSRVGQGRIVLRGGQPLPAHEAALPDWRELDGLRR
jgi:cytosine/adenosine deaminase-related metal-dependent hydrolase